ncbi:MAG TPA: cyanophycin synthetase [Isosphaeraceae bacterium]|jgi:cyanophycin synthetase|nr:cyanophycin synthetase [Isosphaeraceae bacterium]
MLIRKVLALRGPNYWAKFPVLEAWVDLQELKDSPSDSLPGFNDRVMAWLPTMIEHRCSVGERGGFFERLRRGTYQGHILEHVTLELQTLAGTEVGFGRARETSEEGVYKVAIEYEEEELGRECLETARRLLDAAVHDKAFDINAEIKRLREFAQKVKLGPSTAAIVEAAKARGIPARRLNSESLVQLGQASRRRRILASETDNTSAIGEAIAQDKQLTRSLLRAVGVPVPSGRPVESAEDAWAAARELGTPVVVKPQYGSQGRGVATNLSTRQQVLAAYEAARAESSWIMVEQFAPGADHRLLVVGGRFVAAARREPAQVMGDGRATITQLVDQVNADPRRGDDHATVLSKIRLDAIALGVLAEQGYTPESVPPFAASVLIRRNANLSTGGTAADVTDIVHPEVAARAVEAALAVGLDVAGVDVVAEDIGRPLEVQRGVIVEVNAAPGLRMHLEPSSGKPRPVAEAIVASLFPEGETGRIPIVAVTGVNGKTTTTRLISHILSGTGRTVGMTCTDGIYVGGRRIDSGDCSGPQSARSILLNARVEAAVLETARGGILREGLGFDLCDVAVVTNIGEGDHLGLAGIDTVEQLARVKSTIVDAVMPQGAAVLKADDPLTAAMAKYAKGSLIYFCRDPHHPVMTQHREQGGRVVFDRDGSIFLAEGSHEERLIALTRVPLTHQGRVGFQVENALAAAAATWSLQVSLPSIRAGLESFVGDIQHTPGRFNVLHAEGATVILDYGHNTSALAALIDAIAAFPHQRRSTVFSVAGDRRDEDIVRQGEIIGDAFDRVHIYEDACNRGRADGDIIAFLRRGLEASTRVSEITETRGELVTIDVALNALQPGDLLVIQPDQVELTLSYVQRALAAGLPSRRSAALETAEAALESDEGYAAAPAAAWERGELILKD